MTLVLGGPAPVRSGNPPPTSPGSVRLAAFSVTSGPGHSTTLIMRKGMRLDPDALRQALAQHGIPALVTVGALCRSTLAAPIDIGQILHPSVLADGSDVMMINGSAMPSGTRLSIGYFPGQIRMALIEDGAALSCSSTSRQPAMHVTPSGTPIRG